MDKELMVVLDGELKIALVVMVGWVLWVGGCWVVEMVTSWRRARRQQLRGEDLTRLAHDSWGTWRRFGETDQELRDRIKKRFGRIG